MISWILANIGTITISIALALIVTGIVISLVKDKKQGKSTCGGNCAHCKMCASCHRADNDNSKVS